MPIFFSMGSHLFSASLDELCVCDSASLRIAGSGQQTRTMLEQTHRNRMQKPRQDRADGRDTVIRQSISCDICGTEKKQTNHWFVAYEQGAELRVSGWNACNRLRPGTKHLCGQTCLHKLMDDFMARTIAVRPAQAAVEELADAIPVMPTDTSLTVAGDDIEFESSARLLTPVATITPRPLPHATAELVTMPAKAHAGELPLEEPSRYASRHWRAEAWERERERTQRGTEHKPEIVRRQSRM